MSQRTATRIAIFCAVVLFVGFPVIGHYRAKGQVSTFRRALKQNGEKTTLTEILPAVDPAAVKAGERLMAAVDAFGDVDSGLSNLPPAVKFIAPGRAVIRWKQDPLPNHESTNVWPLLARLLKERRHEMAVIRSVASGPPPTLDLNYSLLSQLPMPHLSRLKCAGQLLSAAALDDLRSGELTNALANLRALCALCQPAEEPLLWSARSRSQIGETALMTTWEALQRPGWTDQQLQDLQRAWQSLDWLKQAERGVAMERLWSEQSFFLARQSFPLGCPVCSKKGVAEAVRLCQGVLKEPLEGMKDLVARYPGYWAWNWWGSYDEELATMRVLQKGTEAMRDLRRQERFGPVLSGLETNVAAMRRAHPYWLGLMDAHYHSVQQYLSEVQAAEVRRSLCVAAIALERWRLRHGEYPEDLTSVIPEFLPELPRDLMDGAPLRYRSKQAGSFLLYCIGENGTDDAGDPALPSHVETWKVSQWWRGRDAVWPGAATKSESLAYFEQLRDQAAGWQQSHEAETAAIEAFRRRYGLQRSATEHGQQPVTNAMDAFRKRYGLK